MVLDKNSTTGNIFVHRLDEAQSTKSLDQGMLWAKEYNQLVIYLLNLFNSDVHLARKELMYPGSVWEELTPGPLSEYFVARAMLVAKGYYTVVEMFGSTNCPKWKRLINPNLIFNSVS